MSVAAPLVLREGDRSRLEALTRSSSIRAGLAQRARIVLLAADGLANTEIARRTGTSRPTVVGWRDRYETGGVAALQDLPRSGRPPEVDEIAVVVATLADEGHPPDKLGTQVNGEGGKSSEITAFAPLLDRIDLTDTLLTADALHTQRGHAEYLHARGGHYLLIAKANQPKLYAQLVGLPWAQIPVADEQHDRGHGRVEHRLIKITAVGAGIGFPHARLAVQIVRRRRPIASTRASSETVYAVTSLPWRQARPDLVAEAIRGHWRIEALHWIRDVSFGEDLSQIRTDSGPAVMATLRNFAVSRHRLAGDHNIAHACRRTARHPNRALALLT
jgi:predicted transposase YbfD/YdcC